jgi:hypothetical protein
MLGDSTTKII